MKLILFVISLFLCSGCGAGSLNLWLPIETQIDAQADLEGKWAMTQGNKSEPTNGLNQIITIERKKRNNDLNIYEIIVYNKITKSTFRYRAMLHEVNEVKFLQIFNYSHDDNEMIRFSYTPIITLWRIEFDKNNAIIWIPNFIFAHNPKMKGHTLSTNQFLPDIELKTQFEIYDDSFLFTDKTEVLYNYINLWTEKYSYPEKKMPLLFTRPGSKFEEPAYQKK